MHREEKEPIGSLHIPEKRRVAPIRTLVVLGAGLAMALASGSAVFSSDPDQSVPEVASTPLPESIREQSSSDPPPPSLTANQEGLPSGEWEEYAGRLRDLTREQVRVRTQQEMLRRRLGPNPDVVGDRVRERAVVRLHELDEQERRVRREKMEVLSEIAVHADALQGQLKSVQDNLLARKEQANTDDSRKQVEERLREVEILLRRLPEIQQNPGRFIDLAPARWEEDEATSGLDLPPPPPPFPPEGPHAFPPERFAMRRMRQIEDQIRFLRARIDGLERELNQLKRAVEQRQGRASSDQDTRAESVEPGYDVPENARPEYPAPDQGFDRWRRPDRPPAAPRRDPIPPAGFAPGAVPGLEPEGNLSAPRPGLPPDPPRSNQNP